MFDTSLNRQFVHDSLRSLFLWIFVTFFLFLPLSSVFHIFSKEFNVFFRAVPISFLMFLSNCVQFMSFCQFREVSSMVLFFYRFFKCVFCVFILKKKICYKRIWLESFKRDYIKLCFKDRRDYYIWRDTIKYLFM